MRIAVVNQSRRRVGGAEYYLSGVIPALTNSGHATALCYETDQPSNRALIVSEEMTTWGVEALGVEEALAGLRRWSPDLLYCHGAMSSEFERRLLDVAPAVFFAHGYHGTCISGAKTWRIPMMRPCSRRFGWPCLLHFYPHRCGGLSPVTMVREYRHQAKRLELLRRYRAIVTHSHHVRNEYLKHGFPPERVHRITHGIVGRPLLSGPTRARSETPWRLLFMGRMERLKGGRVLLDALPQLRRRLGRHVHVTFVGDGTDRGRWQLRAARLTSQDPGLSVTFVGWVERPDLAATLQQTDLLVLPSVWPEPFGQIGPEVGFHGIPVAAFATGGIPDWLEDGVNGCLAPGDPPTPSGLADAVVGCLRDPAVHARLRKGALEVATRYRMEVHVAQLLTVFAAINADSHIQ